MNQLILNHSKPNTTYRAARKLPQRKRLAVTCPACHFKRLIDTGDATKSKTYQPGEQGYDGADYYQKCHNCGTEIGISKL